MIGTLKKVLALPLTLLLWTALPALAQKNSISISSLGSIPTSTSTSNFQQNPSSGAGMMIEFTRMATRLLGYNVSYSFRHADQQYSGMTNCSAGGSQTTCPTMTESVPTWAHTVTFNGVVSLPLPVARFHAFALAGGGFESFNPLYANEAPTRNDSRGVFDYGVGLNWPFLSHLGLRLQYRGLLYKAPRVADAFNSTGSLVHDAQPVVGVYYRF